MLFTRETSLEMALRRAFGESEIESWDRDIRAEGTAGPFLAVCAMAEGSFYWISCPPRISYKTNIVYLAYWRLLGGLHTFKHVLDCSTQAGTRRHFEVRESVE